jgi:hypothetical protein
MASWDAASAAGYGIALVAKPALKERIANNIFRGFQAVICQHMT